MCGRDWSSDVCSSDLLVIIAKQSVMQSKDASCPSGQPWVDDFRVSQKNSCVLRRKNSCILRRNHWISKCRQWKPATLDKNPSLLTAKWSTSMSICMSMSMSICMSMSMSMSTEPSSEYLIFSLIVWLSKRLRGFRFLTVAWSTCVFFQMQCADVVCHCFFCNASEICFSTAVWTCNNIHALLFADFLHGWPTLCPLQKGVRHVQPKEGWWYQWEKIIWWCRPELKAFDYPLCK